MALELIKLNFILLVHNILEVLGLDWVGWSYIILLLRSTTDHEGSLASIHICRLLIPIMRFYYRTIVTIHGKSGSGS